MAPTELTSDKSISTNIQARYAKESPKIGDGRRNISSGIVERALESKGEAQRARFLKEFPQAKDVSSLSRKAQEKILSALQKAKFST